MRWVLAFIAAAACSSPSRTPTQPTRPLSEPATLLTIADEYYRARLAAYPEEADWTAVTDKHYDRLSNHSPAALAAWRALEDRWRTQLRAIDTSSLVPKQRALHAMLLEEVESSVGVRVCKPELWPASPLSALAGSLPANADQAAGGRCLCAHRCAHAMAQHAASAGNRNRQHAQRHSGRIHSPARCGEAHHRTTKCAARATRSHRRVLLTGSARP